jgi:hypothetical protein
VYLAIDTQKKYLYQNNNDNDNNIFYSILPYVSSFPKMSLFHQLFLQNVMKICMFAYYNMKGKVSTIAA